MSYALSAALQAAVYARLSGDPQVTALTGRAIYDSLPAGALPDTYVTLGPEDVTARSSRGVTGSRHDFVVSVHTDAAGFQAAKDIGGAISDALIDAPITLSRGTLSGLEFLRARARRQSSRPQRQIDLWFRARVDDDTP